MTTTVHCTYPDGETSEARYHGHLADMLDLYDQFPDNQEPLTPEGMACADHEWCDGTTCEWCGEAFGGES